MKTLKYILSAVLLMTVLWSCEKVEDNFDFVSTAAAPSNITAQYGITQDNTGLVTITPNGDGASFFDVYFGDNTTDPTRLKQGASVDHIYTEGNFSVKIAAIGVTGLKTEVTQDLVVSFKAPENLDVIIENDLAVSKKVNVTATADYATIFDVYFGEVTGETPVTANIGGTASYVYQETGTFTIRVVAKGGAIATTEYSEDFEVTAIMQPVQSAATPPSRLDADVISIYSSAYTDVAGTNYNPDWGQSGQGSSYAEFDLNGDKMLQYINLSYQGVAIGETIDVSAMEYLHLDIWTADVDSIETSLINGQDGNSTEKPVWTVLTADEWTSIDIPISAWTDQGLSVNEIFQLKFVGAPWAGGTVFIDNIYFHKAPSEFAKLPITFDSEVDTFTPFLDAEFAISTDPDDVNNPVGMITNHGGGWGWEGVSLALDVPVNFSANNTITMDFYTSTLPHKVLMKFEDSNSPRDGNNNPTVFEEVEVDVAATGWSKLSFEFATTVDYNSIVLFVDGNVYDISGVYYIDNIEQVGADAGQIVFDDFEGNGNITTWFGDACGMDNAYANPYVEGINTSSTVLEYNDTGGQYANVRFDLPDGENFDMQAKHTFTLKIYVPSSDITGSQPNQISLKLQDGKAGEPWAQQTEIIKTIVLDAWQELTFDFSSDVTAGAADPLNRTDFNRVVLQVNSENNNDAVKAYIDDFNYEL